MTSAEVRAELLRALRLDVIGPGPADEAYAREALPQPPSRWYLTGFLVPYEADVEQRQDPSSSEQLDLGLTGSGDDEGTPEPASARKAFLPSSLGVSVLVPSAAKGLRVAVSWGDYRYVPAQEGVEGGARWEREPRLVELDVPVAKVKAQPVPLDVPGSDGLRVVVSTRAVATALGKEAGQTLPSGTRAVSVFLVNHRKPKEDLAKDEALVFQAALTVGSTEPFVPRPNLRGMGANDWDEQVADLQYRDAFEYAVGHGVATCARVVEGECREVETTWLPSAEVEKVDPEAIAGVELSMDTLAALPTAEDAARVLGPLVDAYKAWIVGQRSSAPAEGRAARRPGSFSTKPTAPPIASRLASTPFGIPWSSRRSGSRTESWRLRGGSDRPRVRGGTPATWRRRPGGPSSSRSSC